MRRIFFLLLLLPTSAMAGAAYKCTAAKGTVIYQDVPCAKGQRQETLDLPQDLGPPPSAPSTPDSGEQTAAAPPAAAPSKPVAPLPTMFVCLKATDGKSYISAKGDPQPYLVPFGILGAAPQPLAQVYGAGGGGGASAPELNRGKINPNLVGNNFVWVRDQCRPLSASETCSALRDDYDDVESKLGRAFKSDRPPLEKRETKLLAQLASCNR